MKDINEMSYEELQHLEDLLTAAKSKFYKVNELYVLNNHFCSIELAGNYAFLGSQTPVDYYDIFSGDFIEEYRISVFIPNLKEVLDDCDIPYKEFMLLDELKEILKQYESKTNAYKKQR